MTKLFCLCAGLGVFSVRVGMAQNPPAPPPAPAAQPAARPAPATPQIDCKWLSVDSATKTATLQLIAGLTGVNGALNFNGFKDGGLTFTVPVNWNVVVNFTNNDGMLPHSAEVIDSVKPMPAGPGEPALPPAQTRGPPRGRVRPGEKSRRLFAKEDGTEPVSAD